MLFRSAVPRVIFQRLNRPFHSSRILFREDHGTHYETLQVPSTATPQEVKKSFYALSKIHHPDHNTNDPEAGKRFVKISEAYAILGSPEKRQRYDHEVLPASRHRPANARPHGSYHSTNPAGGRPASGLSRRRAHFQGPPPSFYRSGGWGAHSAKRSEAAEGPAKNAQAAGQKAYTGGEPAEPGMGPGQAAWRDGNGVPHFDKEGHLRTHANQERRRQRRMDGNGIPDSLPPGLLANFFFITAIISVGIFVPSYLFERMSTTSKSEKQ